MTDPNPASILDSVKKVLGLTPDMTQFDMDVIMHINSVIGSLLEVGVGPTIGLVVEDNTTQWTSLTTDGRILNLVKSFMYQKVKLIFDPPPTSFGLQAINEVLQEYLWRISILAEAVNPPDFPNGSPGVSWLGDGSVSNVHWWDITGLDDFPDGAVAGDLGVDFDEGNLYADISPPNSAYWWDLTGLDDFPSDSLVGDWGIDTSTGNVYRRSA